MTMDRQQYVRLLHARIEHVDAALQRALDVDYGRLGKKHVEALKGAAERIAGGAEDDWHHHREDVERSLRELAEELEAHESVPHEAAESVKDGALELFRGEPSEVLRRAEAVLQKARELRGE
jgi:hypothetical protein